MMKSSTKLSLFEAIGGIPTLDAVHKNFYDKVYAHPWLKQFFVGHDQSAIERRQTEFMGLKMGGDIEYWGKEPKMAHRHMYITAELFELRMQLLQASIEEYGVAEDLKHRWLKIDAAFKRKIVKDSIEDFYKSTWRYERRIIIPKATVADL